jgi:hypothetical protein
MLLIYFGYDSMYFLKEDDSDYQVNLIVYGAVTVIDSVAMWLSLRPIVTKYYVMKYQE